MCGKYSIGADFGTLSVRTLLIDIENGNEIAEAVSKYKHGVISEKLPDTEILLPDNWALQDPYDYVESLKNSVSELLSKVKVDSQDIVGMGVDFTACTILPVDKEGTPLCKIDKYKNNPNSWVKLWKHHAAQNQADRLNKIAHDNTDGDGEFVKNYGGKISSEWFVPKVMQILEESPDIYFAADKFVEASDWIIFRLTGERVRNNCAAGFKCMWNKKQGYPGKDFFKSLDSRLENFVDDKLWGRINFVGTRAGELTEQMAKELGLKPFMPVAVAILDAQVAVPAVGALNDGDMVMVMGTSLCHILISKEYKQIHGISGVVEDGVIPGYYAYEAGQSAVGDMFEWFMKNCITETYIKEAEKEGKNIFSFLEEKADKLTPGEDGLLVLDWWNGNRSIFNDSNLSGIILGLTINTKPEEIYRALIESVAFGTNAIAEQFSKQGLIVKNLYACGGIAKKNRLMLQIISDVLNVNIKVASSDQAPALGAAMYGAVAAGSKNGGYEDIFEASRKMRKIDSTIIKPIPENVEKYKVIYQEYKKLYDYFGSGINKVMKKLKMLKEKEKLSNER